ncbi:MAG: DUF1116 domain-containing protein [Nakamurella sp.]
MKDLLAEPAAVICSGVDLLADALRGQAVEVVDIDFRPAAVEDTSALNAVLADARRSPANKLAAQRMLAVRAQLIDIRPAADALSLRRGEFLHAGPPIEFSDASGPLRGALIGAMIFEGLAVDADEATTKLETGDRISIGPCHDRHAVGPMAGVISPSMWLFELADEMTGARAWCSLNEGLGKVLRYGAYSAQVIDRLHWMADTLGPALAKAVRAAGPIDITAIIGQMVQMGDEGHNRNRAGTLMFLREILPALISSGLPPADVAEVARFVSSNDHFFLNLVMPAGKLMGDAAAGIPGSTVVTAMCRNGTDFGIRVSGTGNEWFTGPALYPDGLFLAGFGPDDANPDIGDSAIAETMGIGGMVMATAPAIVRFVGGSVPDALAVTGRMYEITEAENPAFAVPILEFRGAPTGIDVTRVLRTGILPQINTGMAGRIAGTGQVGAGLVTPPMECFTAAIAGLASCTDVVGRNPVQQGASAPPRDAGSGISRKRSLPPAVNDDTARLGGLDPASRAGVDALLAGLDHEELVAAGEVRDALIAGLGSFEGGQLPDAGSAAWLAASIELIPIVADWMMRRGVAETIVLATLSDVGRQLVLHQQHTGKVGFDVPSWMGAVLRGNFYQLGRLQFDLRRWQTAEPRPPVANGDWLLDVHIPATGALGPAAVSASFDQAEQFFAGHYPDQPVGLSVCGSWLLDPYLTEHLAATSNLLAFQQQFTPYGDPRDDALDAMYFVFGRRSVQNLSELPRKTSLQRLILERIEAGGSWQFVRGYRPFRKLSTATAKRAGSSNLGR